MAAMFTSALKRTFFFIGALVLGSFAYGQDYNTTMPQQCNPTTGGTEIVTFPMTPASANSDGTLTITYAGDLNSNGETIDFFGDI